MKNTIYVIFGLFALALFCITMLNPSYAEEWLIIDDALDVVVWQISSGLWNFEKVEEEKLIQPVEENKNEEDDTVEAEVTPVEEIDKWGDEDSQVNLEWDSENVESNMDEMGYNKEQENKHKERIDIDEIEDNKEEGSENNKEESNFWYNNVNEWNEGGVSSEDKNMLILVNWEKDVSDLSLFGSFQDDLRINEVEINLNSTNSQLENWTFWEISVNRPNSLNDSDWPIRIVVMDRNLWSPGAWISSDYYWYYYQWWNNYWFTFNSSSTTQKAVWNSTYTGWYYWELFIYGTTDYRQNSAHYNNLWGWWSDAESNNWWLDTILQTQGNRRGPCPEWWHVPSAWEWWLLVKYWAMNNNYGYTPKQWMIIYISWRNDIVILEIILRYRLDDEFITKIIVQPAND